MGRVAIAFAAGVALTLAVAVDVRAEPKPLVCADRAAAGPGWTQAAVARGQLRAFARPDGKPTHAFDRLNENGYPTVFGVLGVVLAPDCRPAWYRVQLPVRPNGAVGYVRARAVLLARVWTRIEIDLSERRVDVFRGPRRVLRAVAAVGSPVTPTPTGRYYVNQKLLAPDPGGPFGPGALGISAFSPVLRDWPQGGPIAIHGTNDPASLGQPVSLGCVRVENRTLLRLMREIAAGTPVQIVP